MQARDKSARQSELEHYYDNNTALFLGLGIGRKTRDIHRPVWGPGTRNSKEALQWVAYQLLQQADELGGRDITHALDLGCGVGATLLALQRAGLSSGVGVTTSNEQVKRARQAALRHEQVIFARLDFCDPEFRQSLLGPRPKDTEPGSPARKFDLAYAIEAFVHATEPAAFFTNAARVLRPGGRLVVCDDFLAAPAQPAHPGKGRRKARPSSPSTRETDLIATFQDGWQAHALMTPAAAQRLARKCGFEAVSDVDLTPWLRLRSLRHQMTGATVASASFILKRLLPHWCQSLRGGAALRRCLADGLVDYRLITWRRT